MPLRLGRRTLNVRYGLRPQQVSEVETPAEARRFSACLSERTPAVHGKHDGLLPAPRSCFGGRAASRFDRRQGPWRSGGTQSNQASDAGGSSAFLRRVQGANRYRLQSAQERPRIAVLRFAVGSETRIGLSRPAGQTGRSQMKQTLQFLLRGYKRLISPALPHSCRFVPTCSEYAIDAVEEHGALRGSWLALRRLLRCQPFAKAGYDPAPRRMGKQELLSPRTH